MAPVQATPLEALEHAEATRSESDPRILVTAFVAAGIAAALGVAYLLPPLAILSVWPLLFVVPGWLLLALAAPRIDAAARLGLAIILSIAVSATFVYWLPVSLGCPRDTVFVASAVMVLPVLKAVY